MHRLRLESPQAILRYFRNRERILAVRHRLLRRHRLWRAKNVSIEERQSVRSKGEVTYKAIALTKIMIANGTVDSLEELHWSLEIIRFGEQLELEAFRRVLEICASFE